MALVLELKTKLVDADHQLLDHEAHLVDLAVSCLKVTVQPGRLSLPGLLAGSISDLDNFLSELGVPGWTQYVNIEIFQRDMLPGVQLGQLDASLDGLDLLLRAFLMLPHYVSDQFLLFIKQRPQVLLLLLL